MERKFLEGLDLDKKGLKLDKDAIDKIMAEHGKTVESQKTLTTNAVAERDALQSSLDDVTKKLGTFEGVDLESLKKEIETLKGDIKTKETEYATQNANRDFNDVVKDAIATAKGLNASAIMGCLKLDQLKSSKNQKEDVAAALKALRESDAYLFEKVEEKKDDNTPAQISSGGSHNEDGGNASKSTNDVMNSAIRGTLKGD
jgi:vacuolar-type H+-ATPase subunit I/STV1